MGDCFSGIHPVGVGYKRANGYSEADFHVLEIPVNEVKSTTGPWPCFKCGETHFWEDA